jgi:DDE superfamily endonuclease
LNELDNPTKNKKANNMNREILDLYSDYLITNFGQATATGLSNVLDGEISHDTITRSLVERELTSKDYWQFAKTTIREVQDDNASISIDDLIVPKPHSEENGVIAYYFDHTEGCMVKGMNIVDATYITPTARVPLDFELVKKLEPHLDFDSNTWKRPQTKTKHEILEGILRNAVQNEVPFKRVLFDVWYGSADNMRLVKLDLKKEFITPIKENRKIRLLERAGSALKAVSTLELEEGKPYLARLEGVPFDVIVVKLVFRHKDDSEGVLFLCSSETGLTGEGVRLGYQKRWSVEEQHKSGKQNTGLGASPASLVVSRVNHVFCSYVGVLKLECLKLETGLNHFALKAKLRLKAVQASWDELDRFREVYSGLGVKSA